MKKVFSMKQAVNFRFTPKTIAIIHQLEEQLHLSKTAVLEQALLYFAKKQLALKNDSLLQFAGIISKEDADSMLQAIKDRKNKNKDIEL